MKAEDHIDDSEECVVEIRYDPEDRPADPELEGDLDFYLQGAGFFLSGEFESPVRVASYYVDSKRSAKHFIRYATGRFPFIDTKIEFAPNDY